MDRALSRLTTLAIRLAIVFGLFTIVFGTPRLPSWIKTLCSLSCTDAHPVRFLEVALVLAAVMACALAFMRQKREATGNVGEAMVQRVLSLRYIGDDYHLLNNVTLPFEDGTTQTDHILVSRYGVFVIETKHYGGWLFADASSPTWTQVIFHFKQKFQNPIHQNYKHVKAVQKLLDFIPPEHIHSCVVFTGSAVFQTERPEGVCDLDSLTAYIERFRTQVISQNRLQFCVGRLECHRKAISGKTDVEHHNYLAQQYRRNL